MPVPVTCAPLKFPALSLKYREKRQGGGAERDRKERNQRGGRSIRPLGQILEEATYDCDGHEDRQHQSPGKL